MTMMSTRSGPRIERQRAERTACRCGEPELCGLHCLERPRFNAGALLSADDLQAGVAYADQRFALRRHGAGVGITSGLHVACDPRREGGVVVEPGHAVGCCGEDLVVCEPLCVDLEALIETYVSSNERSPNSYTGGRGRAFDVRLVPDARPADPVAVMSRRACGHSTSLPSREELGVRMCVEELGAPRDDGAKREQEFQDLCDGFFGRLDVGKLPDRDESPEDRLIRALRVELGKAPTQYRCGLSDELARLAAQRGDAQALWQLAVQLIDDRRQVFLARRYDDCCDRRGVRLAQVWATRRPEPCDRRYAVRAIDNFPWAREELHPEDPWWSPYQVGVYDAYYRDPRDACVLLTDRGLTVERMSARDHWPADRDASNVSAALGFYRAAYCRAQLYVPCGSHVRVLVDRDPVTDRDRVVAVQAWAEGRVEASGATREEQRELAEETSSPRDFAEAAGEGAVGRDEVSPRSFSLDSVPFPFAAVIDGIGLRVQTALWECGVRTLAEFCSATFEDVDECVRPIPLPGWSSRVWDVWRAEGERILELGIHARARWQNDHLEAVNEVRNEFEAWQRERSGG